MMRLFIYALLVTTLFVSPQLASAQRVVEAGDRVRITKQDGTSLTGRFGSIDGEQVVITLWGTSSKQVSRATIERLEVSVSRRSRVLKGILIGGATSGLLLGGIGAATWEGPDMFTKDRSEAFAFGAVVGVPLGIVTGAFVGWVWKADEWRDATFSDGPLGRPNFSITPHAGGAFGLTVSVPTHW